MFRQRPSDLLARGALAAAVLLGLAVSGPRPVAAIGPGVAIVTTAVHDPHHDAVSSVPVGTDVHPYFSVSGLSGAATGSISVFQFNNGTCSGLWDYVYGGVLSSTGRLDAYFLAETSNEPTTISYRGDYQGNGTYGAVDGPCVSVTFTKANPSVVLRMHNAAHDIVTSVKVGATIHAFVDVNGGADAPTGSVKIRQWPNGTCSGSSSLVGPYALSGGQVDTPYGWHMNTAGTFSFRADYFGDSTYNAANSPCLAVTVEKYTATLDSELHDAGHHPVTTVLVGTTVHVSGTLSGSVGTPTGTVNVKQFTNGSCDGGASFIQAIPAGAVMDPAGSSVSIDAPYTLRWQLVYPGDDNYASVTGPCMSITWKASPTVGLTVHDADHDAITSAYVGAPVHLRVAVGGNFDTPTGNVNLKRYANATCSGGGTSIGSPALSSGVVDRADLDVSFASPGTYSFKATYQGDGSYVAKASACTTLTITAVPSTPKPTIAPTPAPTAAPTAAPQVTSAPESLPSAAPSADPSPAPSAEPSAALEPAETNAAASGAPGEDTSAPPAASAAPADDTQTGAGTGTGAGPTTPSGDAGSGSTVLIGFVVLVAFASLIGFLFFARRRRQEALQPS